MARDRTMWHSNEWQTRTARRAFTWRNPDRAGETEVDVTFTPETGGTVVSLTHRGFERLGPDGTAIAARWAGGWPRVMKAFADRARR